AHAQKPILVAAGAAGVAFIIAMTTPLDERLAGFIQRVFAGDQAMPAAPPPTHEMAPRVVYRDPEVIVPSPGAAPAPAPTPSPGPALDVAPAMLKRKHCPTTPPSPPPRCPEAPRPS